MTKVSSQSDDVKKRKKARVKFWFVLSEFKLLLVPGIDIVNVMV